MAVRSHSCCPRKLKGEGPEATGAGTRSANVPIHPTPIPPAGVKLSDLIQQAHFASPAQKAILNVLATEAWMRRRIADTLAPYDVTPAQYNVLRILRGGHPKPYTCSDLGARLLDRTPDVTRLVSRLESAGLVKRERSEADRRMVEVSITPAGLETLDGLDGPMKEVTSEITEHVTDEELRTLSGLLERLRINQTK